MQKIVATILLSLLSVASFAGTIDVLPSIVKLSADQTVSSIQFRNTTDAEASFEIKVVEEIGVGEALQRVPTSDIVVSPPIFSVKPGNRQTVRFSVRKPKVSDTEIRYRLYAEQIPVAAVHEEPGIRMLLNLGIPIFISPRDERIALTGTPSEKGLTIRNDGNVTVHVLGMEATGCDDVKFNRYLRPTATLEIRLEKQQVKNCAYQMQLESGSLPLR